MPTGAAPRRVSHEKKRVLGVDLGVMNGFPPITLSSRWSVEGKIFIWGWESEDFVLCSFLHRWKAILKFARKSFEKVDCDAKIHNTQTLIMGTTNNNASISCRLDYTTYHDERCLPSESTLLEMTVVYNVAVVPLVAITVREALRGRSLARTAMYCGAASLLAQSFMSIGWMTQGGSYEIYFLGFGLACVFVSNFGLALLLFLLTSLTMAVPRKVLSRYRFSLVAVVRTSQLVMFASFFALAVHFSRADRESTNLAVSAALGITMFWAFVYVVLIVLGIFHLKRRIEESRSRLARDGAGVSPGGGGASSPGELGPINPKGPPASDKNEKMERFLSRALVFGQRAAIWLVWISCGYGSMFITYVVRGDTLVGYAFSIVGFSSLYYMVAILHLFLRREYKLNTGLTASSGQMNSRQLRNNSREGTVVAVEVAG